VLTLFGDIDLLGLVEFLHSQQSLVDLAICFDVGMYQTPPLPRSATLSSLRSFQLHLGPKHSRSMTEYVLRSLQMPSLHTFTFSVNCQWTTEDLERITSYVLCGNSALTKIQDFEFRIIPKPPYGAVDLSIVLDMLSSLRSLSITTTNNTPDLYSLNMDRKLLTVINSSREGEHPNIPSSPLPFLERLRLRGNTFSPEFLQQLLSALAVDDPKHLDRLREVVLRDCYRFTNGCLEETYKLVPRSRVLWLGDLPAPMITAL